MYDKLQYLEIIELAKILHHKLNLKLLEEAISSKRWWANNDNIIYTDENTYVNVSLIKIK